MEQNDVTTQQKSNTLHTQLNTVKEERSKDASGDC